MHETILALLEFFEIIYKMRMTSESKTKDAELIEERMFFVPSMLASITTTALEEDTSHISIKYWRQITPKYVKIKQ
jgi:hypothetical protein